MISGASYGQNFSRHCYSYFTLPHVPKIINVGNNNNCSGQYSQKDENHASYFK